MTGGPPALRFAVEPAPGPWWRDLLAALLFWKESAPSRHRVIATNRSGRRVVVAVTDPRASAAELERLRSEFETTGAAAFLAAHKLPADLVDR